MPGCESLPPLNELFALSEDDLPNDNEDDLHNEDEDDLLYDSEDDRLYARRFTSAGDDGRSGDTTEFKRANRYLTTSTKRPMQNGVSSGCWTCRKRELKCDEKRPICSNCVTSKGRCEGYSQDPISERGQASEPSSIHGDATTYPASSSTVHDRSLHEPIVKARVKEERTELQENSAGSQPRRSGFAQAVLHQSGVGYQVQSDDASSGFNLSPKQHPASEDGLDSWSTALTMPAHDLEVLNHFVYKHTQLSEAYRQKAAHDGNYEESKQNLVSAIKYSIQRESVHGIPFDNRIQMCGTLAEICRDARQWQEALKIVNDELPNAPTSLGDWEQYTARRSQLLSSIYFGRYKSDEAPTTREEDGRLADEHAKRVVALWQDPTALQPDQLHLVQSCLEILIGLYTLQGELVAAEFYRSKLHQRGSRKAGNGWSGIAETYPTLSEGSVKKHWYKDMDYAESAEDKSATLLKPLSPASHEEDKRAWSSFVPWVDRNERSISVSEGSTQQESTSAIAAQPTNDQPAERPRDTTDVYEDVTADSDSKPSSPPGSTSDDRNNIIQQDVTLDISHWPNPGSEGSVSEDVDLLIKSLRQRVDELLHRTEADSSEPPTSQQLQAGIMYPSGDSGESRTASCEVSVRSSSTRRSQSQQRAVCRFRTPIELHGAARRSRSAPPCIFSDRAEDIASDEMIRLHDLGRDGRNVSPGYHQPQSGDSGRAVNCSQSGTGGLFGSSSGFVHGTAGTNGRCQPRPTDLGRSRLCEQSEGHAARERLPCIFHIGEPHIWGNDTKRYKYIAQLMRHLRARGHDFHACSKCFTRFDDEPILQQHVCVKSCPRKCCKRFRLFSVVSIDACVCITTPEQQWCELYLLAYPGSEIPNVFGRALRAEPSDGQNPMERTIDNEMQIDNASAELATEHTVPSDHHGLLDMEPSQSRAMLSPASRASNAESTNGNAAAQLAELQRLREDICRLEQRVAAQSSPEVDDLRMVLGNVWLALVRTGSTETQAETPLWMLVRRFAPNVLSTAPSVTLQQPQPQPVVADDCLPLWEDWSNMILDAGTAPQADSGYWSGQQL